MSQGLPVFIDEPLEHCRLLYHRLFLHLPGFLHDIHGSDLTKPLTPHTFRTTPFSRKEVISYRSLSRTATRSTKTLSPIPYHSRNRSHSPRPYYSAPRSLRSAQSPTRSTISSSGRLHGKNSLGLDGSAVTQETSGWQNCHPLLNTLSPS